MITIADIDVSDVNVQISIEALMNDHFEEVYNSSQKTTLQPNWELYTSLKKEGSLISMGAFYKDVLVGYIGLVLIEPPHYMGSIVAISDTIFLHREFRDGSAGIRMMNTARNKAKEKGAKEVQWAAKPNSALLYILNKRKNTKVRDIIYSEEV